MLYNTLGNARLTYFSECAIFDTTDIQNVFIDFRHFFKVNNGKIAVINNLLNQTHFLVLDIVKTGFAYDNKMLWKQLCFLVVAIFGVIKTQGKTGHLSLNSEQTGNRRFCNQLLYLERTCRAMEHLHLKLLYAN